ncbi:MAG TPA: hypothetical protein EYO01_06795 [Phycisphaerales bacterium]|nr:hypothetical protein [Phycisphaerales bacterium]HIB50186.1 hypothetical protein [Phycisphaerales bacterium]HIN84228.1 hypothetical protein [Phycisphaerales bacterium]HIO20628.1 hypothetical protein [Phycisphaerales bacterium]HIO52890.1 hypothetical protein [Phycisphaerales bacterium]
MTTLPIDETIQSLGSCERATQGVNRVANRWHDSDGGGDQFKSFCEENFIKSEEDRTRLLSRFESAMGSIGGHLYEIGRHLRRWTDLRGDEMHSVDNAMAMFDPCPDLSDQFYKQKIAFIALLNFTRPDLETMLQDGCNWTTDEWAEARIGRAFGPRIPSEVNDRARELEHEANMFVSEFHVPVGCMVDSNGKAWFEKDRKLIAHWLIREEIKAGYTQDGGIEKQRALASVMRRHIDGTIPKQIMDSTCQGLWDPKANTIDGNDPGELLGPVRYEQLATQRSIAVDYDKYYEEHPSAIARKFDLEREIPEETVEALMIELLKAPVRKDIATFMEEKLGRPLEAFDIYLEDISEGASSKELDEKVTAMFKDELEFQSKIPDVLRGLGFSDEDADFLGSRVNVEIARGAGHAMRPGIPEYNAWLRTNRLDDRLGWDGFDTAMHELGHNLEQLISTHFVPRPLLRNVPNTACTEAFAFLYQNKAKEVVGLPEEDEAKAFAFASVEGLLAACQIAGPSLVELYTWRWLYKNPKATPEKLRDEMLSIAKDVWDTYFKEYFGEDHYHILAAYQHMIGYPLYLPDYTIGHVISHQIKSHMRGKDLAAETKRICSIGRLTPDQWMKNAVGSPISASQLIEDATSNLNKL